MITINILTRTSNRPNYFRNNYNSIINQKFESNIKINHIVSYDTKETYEYLKNYDRIKIIEVNKFTRTKTHSFPYNIYFNEMHKHIESGFIMYLDDDDSLNDDNSINQIINELDENKLLIWRVKSINNRIIPNINNIKNRKICYCDFTSNCFIYHSKWLENKKLLWQPVKGGDYKFGLLLFKTIKQIKTIDKIICKIDNFSGNGMQNDNLD
jgi:hypothetical protein